MKMKNLCMTTFITSFSVISFVICSANAYVGEEKDCSIVRIAKKAFYNLLGSSPPKDTKTSTSIVKSFPGHTLPEKKEIIDPITKNKNISFEIKNGEKLNLGASYFEVTEDNKTYRTCFIKEDVSKYALLTVGSMFTVTCATFALTAPYMMEVFCKMNNCTLPTR